MFLDIVTVQSDQRAEGSELPDYQPLYVNVPARIITTGGQETYRGRQLEEQIDFVVQMAWDQETRVSNA